MVILSPVQKTHRREMLPEGARCSRYLRKKNPRNMALRGSFPGYGYPSLRFDLYARSVSPSYRPCGKHIDGRCCRRGQARSGSGGAKQHEKSKERWAVLSERGVTIRNRRREVAYQPSLLLVWLTPAERPALMLRAVIFITRRELLLSRALKRQSDARSYVMPRLFSTNRISLFPQLESLCSSLENLARLFSNSKNRSRWV